MLVLYGNTKKTTLTLNFGLTVCSFEEQKEFCVRVEFLYVDRLGLRQEILTISGLRRGEGRE